MEKKTLSITVRYISDTIGAQATLPIQATEGSTTIIIPEITAKTVFASLSGRFKLPTNIWP